MTLQVLLDKVSSLINHGASNNDIVRIELSEPSIGARASCGIKSISIGFDWEAHQIRIVPDVALCRVGRTKNDALCMNAHRYLYDRRTVVTYHCPICGEKLSKTAKYCLSCGQKVFMKPGQISFEQDYRTKQNN